MAGLGVSKVGAEFGPDVRQLSPSHRPLHIHVDRTCYALGAHAHGDHGQGALLPALRPRAHDLRDGRRRGGRDPQATLHERESSCCTCACSLPELRRWTERESGVATSCSDGPHRGAHDEAAKAPTRRPLRWRAMRRLSAASRVAGPLLTCRALQEIERDPLFRLDDIHDLTKNQMRERTMAKVRFPRSLPRRQPATTTLTLPVRVHDPLRHERATRHLHQEVSLPRPHASLASADSPPCL